MFLANACLKSNGWQEKSTKPMAKYQNLKQYGTKPSFSPVFHEGQSNIRMAPDL